MIIQSINLNEKSELIEASLDIERDTICSVTKTFFTLTNVNYNNKTIVLEFLKELYYKDYIIVEQYTKLKSIIEESNFCYVKGLF